MWDHGRNEVGTLFMVPCQGRCEAGPCPRAGRGPGCGLTGVGSLSPSFQSGAEWEG